MEEFKSRRQMLALMAQIPLFMIVGPIGRSLTGSLQRSGKVLPVAVVNAPSLPFAKIDAGQLSDCWSSAAFTIYESGETVLNGWAIKLPDGEVAAFQQQCETLGCRLELITDHEHLKRDFNYTSAVPMLACRCHQNVFDLQTGESVSGPDRPALKRLSTKKCRERICVFSDDQEMQA